MFFSAILTAVIFLAAGFLQGLAGFGAGLLAVPLLLLHFDITVAVPASVLTTTFLNIQLCASYRKYITLDRILPLFLGSIPGIALGSLVLVNAPTLWIRGILGMLLIMYGFWGLFGTSGEQRTSELARGWGYVGGFVSGVMGATFSANGPGAIVYVSLTKWPKNVIRGTLAGYFLANCITTVSVQLVTGLITREVVLMAATGLAGVVLGGWLGVRVCRMLGERDYRRTLYALLVIMGGSLLVAVVR